MFPENIVQATMQQMETTVQVVNKTIPGRDPIRYKPVYKDGMNILGFLNKLFFNLKRKNFLKELLFFV